MPCYEISLTTVEFKVKNLDLLEKAIADSLGWNYSIIAGSTGVCVINIVGKGITINLKDQTITCSDRQQDLVNRLKQQYSHEVIKQAAKKKRWILSSKEQNKYIARRY